MRAGYRPGEAVRLRTVHLKLYEIDEDTLVLENLLGGIYKKLQLGELDLDADVQLSRSADYTLSVITNSITGLIVKNGQVKAGAGAGAGWPGRTWADFALEVTTGVGYVTNLLLWEATKGGEIILATNPETSTTWHIDNDTGGTPGSKLRIFSQPNLASSGTVYLQIDGTYMDILSSILRVGGINPAGGAGLLNVVVAAGGTSAVFSDNTNSEFYIRHPSAGIICFDSDAGNQFRFAAGGTDELIIDSAGNLGMKAGGHAYGVGGVVGYSVLSTTLTIGSAGAMIIPYANMSDAANDAARDALAGNLDGAIALDSKAATFKFWGRFGGVWKSVTLS
jgi:hypothetical protein